MTARKIAGLVTALLMMVALVPLVAVPAFAEGQGSPDECESGIEAPGDDNLRSYTAPEGQVVEGVCIRSGSNMFDSGHSDVLGNGTYEGCYQVSGVGTRTVTVARVGPASPSCQELSHVDVLLDDEDTSSSSSTTSTTEASTTTTTEESSTTTTEESSTTTTEESTTTTTTEGEEEEETTTTTEGEEEETTTTTETEVEGETTSTTEEEVEEETTSTTETDDDTEETLPFTGTGTDGIALVALLALLAGAGLISLTRGSAESDVEG